MNFLSPTEADLNADKDLTNDLKAILGGIGKIVSDDHYNEDGDLIQEPQPGVDEEVLNQRWREAYILLRQAFRQELLQSQWEDILKIGLDYNYAPTKFRNHIARYWQSIEDIIEGREPSITGRESGVEKLGDNDAEPRRHLCDILDEEKPKFAFSEFKKAVKKLVGVADRDVLNVINIVLSCNRGEVGDKRGEYIGRTVLELYKTAPENVQSDIIALVHALYDKRNLRGNIKKVLTGFTLDGDHPFWFLQAKHGVTPAFSDSQALGQERRNGGRGKRRFR